MSISLRRTIAPERFTPEGQETKDNPAKFLLRCLSTPELETIYSADGGKFAIASNQTVLKMGVQDWANIVDPDTEKDIDFSFDGMSMLDIDTRSKLVTRIFNISAMSEESEKN